jgi:hypothetical protein
MADNSKSNPVILTSYSEESLKETLRGIIREELLRHEQSINPSATGAPRFHSRKETASALNISLPTLDRYSKSGIIDPTKIGSRVLYSEEEIKRCAEYFTIKHHNHVRQ